MKNNEKKEMLDISHLQFQQNYTDKDGVQMSEAYEGVIGAEFKTKEHLINSIKDSVAEMFYDGHTNILIWELTEEYMVSSDIFKDKEAAFDYMCWYYRNWDR